MNHSSEIFSCDCSQIIFLGLFLFSSLLFTLLTCFMNRICLEFLSNDSQPKSQKKKLQSITTYLLFPLPINFLCLENWLLEFHSKYKWIEVTRPNIELYPVHYLHSTLRARHGKDSAGKLSPTPYQVCFHNLFDCRNILPSIYISPGKKIMRS